MRVKKPAVLRDGGRQEVWSAPRKRGPSSNSNEKRRRGGSNGNAAAEKAESASVSFMYDSSDSFENHVIDLRGDEYRSVTSRDEDDQTLGDFQSSQEVSVDSDVDIEFESNMDTTQISGQGSLYNGTTVRNKKEQDDIAEECTHDGPSRLREQKIVPGQLVWAKLARFPWWPAQVMDERAVKEGRGGTPVSSTDRLVRFFGTYDYGWVDPFANLSEFQVKQAERSRVRKRALQKGVEEALLYQNSGKLPKNWEPVLPPFQYRKGQYGHTSEVATQSADTFRKTSRKRKPKILFEESRVQRKPQRLLRRIRIMRQLGLAAPAGSPFISDCYSSIK